MKLLKSFFVCYSFILVCISCSTKKDTFISRNYNALKTNYNILYNGQLAYDDGLKAISEKHEDNFWKRLPIEPITFDPTEIDAPKFKGPTVKEDASGSSQKAQTPFDRAEEKAAKAIQKHSMFIDEYEKNSRTDEAYLLLGKSRYYTQRFIPAIEAYNYIIANYPKADLHYETRVWRAKANTRLGNEERAIETLNLLLNVLDNKEEVSKRVKEEAYTAMAMAYAETDTIQKMIDNLKFATRTFINKEQSARNMFVLGQIYNDLNQKDSAKLVFRALADKRAAPRKYRVHANIELAKNFEGDTSSVGLIKRFYKLIRNPDNRPYLDELYYQVGVLHEDHGNKKCALEYFKKSKATTTGSDYQKTYTYERLGNINFKDENYLKAGAYYDTVLQISSGKYDDEKRIRKIRRKNKNLTTLRKYDSIVTINDSILNLVNMNTEERTAFFEKHIEKIKKEDQEKRQQQLNAQNFGGEFGLDIGLKNKKDAGKWYFYNSQSLTFGEKEFKRLWGNIPLEDNWRWSNKTSLTELEEEEIIVENPRYVLSNYTDAIPSDEKEINELTDYRNSGLYQLGILYKEQFKNNAYALKNLERLQGLNKKEKMKLPIQYHLYQLYLATGKEAQANQAKNYILKNYPDSKFAEAIQYPTRKLVAKDQDINEIEKKYKVIYQLYNHQDYLNTLIAITHLQEDLDNNSEFIPKLALIKALAIGKTKSKEEYIKELEYVAISFANEEQGKKAQEILKLLQ